MGKFLADTAKYILDKHGANLSDITVLMPNHRSCVYLRQAMKDAATGPVWSPEIITLQEWVSSKSNLALIESLQQLTELYDVYKLIGGEEALDEFVSTAQIMLSDFNEVDLQIANAKSFFNYLERLQSLNVYEPGGEPTEYTVRYKRFWQMFRELYFGLREVLLTKKCGYAGMIFRDVAERIEALEPDSQRIYLVGFSSLNKTEEIIIKALVDKGIAELIWDTDRYYVEDNFQEAGLSFRKYSRPFKVDKSKQNDLIATQARNINIIGVAKNIGQTRVVTDILNKLNLNERSERQTAVIVPDEKLLNPLLAAIPDSVSALNISMGFPVYESSLAELLKAIFALHDSMERFGSTTGKQLRFYYRNVFDLLHHPYTIFLIPNKGKVTDFMERIRERNWMMVGFKELAREFDQTEFEDLFWYTNDSGEYLDKILELLESLRKHFLRDTRSGARDLSMDIEILFFVTNTLRNLRNVIGKNKAQFTVASLRKLILENMRPLRIPFDGEPVRGLQIMGMLETRCLDFKNIIIVSMNEGIVPSAKNQQTYIPYEMRREFLTTHQDKDANAAYLFYRLLQRAENVYLLYNTEGDELGGGEKSRFILQLQHELNKANPLTVVNEYVFSVDPPPVMPDNDITIHKDETVMKALTNLLTVKGISPTALNSYINCSLQYYMRYIANLREQDDLEEGIEASTLGTAVHYVLEKLYDSIKGQELSVDFINKIIKDKKHIEELFRKSIEDRFDAESIKQGKNYLLYRVGLKLIDEFLKREIANLQMMDDSGSAIRLLMLEGEMIHPLTISGTEVRVKGKVDRVEEDNGIVSVVDYKTGTPIGSSIKGDDIAQFASDPKYAKAMQLMMYAWLYWRSNGTPDIRLRSGIYWLRNSTRGFDSLRLDGNDIITSAALLQFEGVLNGVLAELLNPEIPFTKTKDAERCANCEFVRICRRG